MIQTLPNDDTLVENARHDPDAFAALYQRYLTPILLASEINGGGRPGKMVTREAEKMGAG